jgi:hypothetical protein
VSILGSSFVDNTALHFAGTFSGGVLSANGGASINITSSKFTRNTMASMAACVAALGNTFLRIDSCLFEENSAFSGAAAILSTDSPTRITNTIFKGNFLIGSASTQSRGTAIALDAAALAPTLLTELINCNFTSNFVNPSSGITASGAIHISRRPALIEGCSFKNNSAYVGAAITIINSQGLVIRCSTFSGNEACFGGAVYLSAQATAVQAAVIESSLFTNNRAYKCREGITDVFGGAIAVFGFPEISLSGNSFFANAAVNPETTRRGLAAAVLYSLDQPNAILTSTANLYKGNVVFTGRLVGELIGHVVRVQIGAPLNVRLNFVSDLFFNNSLIETIPDGKPTASTGGALGAVSFGATAASNPIISVIHCDFIKNFATTAPAFHFSNVHSTIVNSTFVNNLGLIAAGSGAYTSDTLAGVRWKNTIQNSVFEGNLANLGDASKFAVISDILIQAISCPAPEEIWSDLIIKGDNRFLSYNEASEFQYYHVGGRNCTSIAFVPADGQPLGVEAIVPKVILVDGAIIDSRNVSASSPSIAIVDNVREVPSKILVGDYNLTIGPIITPFRNFRISGLKNTSTVPGKLIFTSYAEFSSRFSWTVENLDIVVKPNGTMTIYGKFLDLNNCDIFVEEGGYLFLPRFDFVHLVRDITPGNGVGSSIDVFGNFQLSNGIFDRVNVTTHGGSRTNYFVTNFWPDSHVDTFGGGSFSVDGTFVFDFTYSKFFEAPTLGQRFLILNISTRVEAPSLSFSSKGGYLVGVESTPSNLSFLIEHFSPIDMRISDDLAGIDITFPLRTSALPSRNCSLLLTSETLDALPSNVECAWQNANLLRIRTVQVPATVQFVPGAISDLRNSMFYAKVAVGRRIEPPAHPLPPVAVITAPSLVPTCSSWTLDGSTSFRIGDVRNATFSWRLLSQNSAALQGILASATTSRVNIPANVLTDAESYTFALNVINSAGLSAETTMTVVGTNQVLLVDVEGPQSRSVFSYLPTILNGRVEIQSGCSITEIGVEKRWVLPPGLASANFTLGDFSLEIPEFSLQPFQNYTFEFLAWPRGYPQLSVSKTVELVVGPAPLSIQLSGDIGLVPATRNTTTVGRVIDTNGDLSTGSVRWEWSVISCDGFADLSQAGVADRIALFLSFAQKYATPEVAPVSGASCVNATGSLFLVREKFALNTSSLTIPAGLFGKEILMGAKAISMVDGRVASKLLYLNFTSTATVQTIGIDILGEQQGKILPQEKLVARAVWNGQNVVPSNTVVLWGGSESDPPIDTSSS